MVNIFTNFAARKKSGDIEINRIKNGHFVAVFWDIQPAQGQSPITITFKKEEIIAIKNGIDELLDEIKLPT